MEIKTPLLAAGQEKLHVQLTQPSCSELQGCIPCLCGNHVSSWDRRIRLSGGQGQPQPLPWHEQLYQWEQDEEKALLSWVLLQNRKCIVCKSDFGTAFKT